MHRDDGGFYLKGPIDNDFAALWSRIFPNCQLTREVEIFDFLSQEIAGLKAIIAELPKSGPVSIDVGDKESSFEITLFPNFGDVVIDLVDTTGLRSLQRKIQRQHAAIELIDHAHPGALFQVKRDSQGLMSFDFASPRLPEIMEMPGLTVENFIQSMSDKTRDTIYDAFRKSDGTHEIVFEGTLDEPYKRYWTIRASVLDKDDDGSITFLGVLENNTEKMLQLEQIKYTSSFLSSITQNVPIGIAVSNIPKKQYLYVNQELCRITGHPEESFLSGGFAFWRDKVLLHHQEQLFENLDQIRDYYQSSATNFNHSVKLNLSIRTKGGDERHLFLLVRPLGEKSEQGTYDTFIHLLEDITERVRLENQRRKEEVLLIQSNKMAELGEMASCIAHEINNPLSIMSHLLENIESRHSDEEFKHVFQTLDRISKIVKSLTGFARDAGEAGPGDKPIALSSVIVDTMLLCQNRLLNRNISLEYSGDLHACPHINDTLLSQVLLNLINNSYDALENFEQERWMKLTAVIKGNALSITFADSGIAPDIKIMQSWFEPFYTSKPKGKGTGLGLSICQNLLRAAGGAIRPLNTKHTSFQISLPLWKESEST